MCNLITYETCFLTRSFIFNLLHYLILFYFKLVMILLLIYISINWGFMTLFLTDFHLEFLISVNIFARLTYEVQVRG